MQRAFWYTGLVGGGTAFFISLIVVGSLLVNGMIAATAPAATGDTAAPSHDANSGVRSEAAEWSSV